MSEPMQVFISWSGDKSRPVAKALSDWLPTVLAGAVNCFMSDQGIGRGDRGMNVIAGELEKRDFGIVVLTSENLNAPWIHFEAGALSKSLGAGKVAPLLLDITRADVDGPLSQFQSTLLTERDDFQQFVRDLATHVPHILPSSVDALFDAKWPELEATITRAAGTDSPKTTRSPESMLEEVLNRLRAMDQPRSTRTYTRGGGAWKNTLSKLIYDTLRRTSAGGPIRFEHDSSLREGDTARVHTPSVDVEFDGAALQEIADEWDVRIIIEPHDVMFSPRGRFRDPVSFQSPFATEDQESASGDEPM